jgi:putative ABC transport system substrate-binding protein
VNAADIERSIELTARAPNTGVIVPPDSSTILHRDLVVALVTRYRLPAVYAFRFFVTAGGLMSYGKWLGMLKEIAPALIRPVIPSS